MPVLHPKHQILPNWLKAHGSHIFLQYNKWLTLYLQNKISAPELTAIYLLLFCKKTKANLWYGGRSPLTNLKRLTSEIKFNEIFSDQNFKSPWDLMTLSEFFTFHTLRGIPFKAQRALVMWWGNVYPLEVHFDIPTAYDLLEVQSRGKRVIWLPSQVSQFENYVHGKDPFEFVIHDLKHADEFFFDRERFLQQTTFYKHVLKSYKQGAFDELLTIDDHFKAEFEYLIADMNSHPEHLRVTLEAIIKHSQFKRENLNNSK